MRKALGVAFLLVAAALVPSRSAAAAAEWEECVTKGINDQNRDRKQMSLDAVVRKAEVDASRPTTGAEKVCRVYLLARAYGLRNDAAKGDRASARLDYAEALRLAPDLHFAYRDLAILDLSETPADARAAEGNLKHALALSPDFTLAMKNLVSIYDDQKRYEEKAALLKRIVDLEPDDPRARPELATAYIALKQFGNARREIEALLKKDPGNAGFRALDAQVDLAEGNYAVAKAKFRVLATENPSVSMFWNAYVLCLEKEKGAGKPIDPTEWIFGLEGMRRQEKDPARLKQLQSAIDAFRAPPAPPTPAGPPSEEALIKLLGNEKPEARIAALKYIYFSPKPLASKDLIPAVIAKVGDKREPSKDVRIWAVRVLGVYGGTGLVRLVRLSLDDAATEVRQAAVDALTRIVEGSTPATQNGVVLILGLYRRCPDLAVASAARAAALRLGSGSIPEPAEGETQTETQRAVLFEDWWNGPAGLEVKNQGLATFGELKDHFPHEVLVPYLDDPDFFVFKAAYQALASASAYVMDDRLKTWLSTIPRLMDSELTKADHAAVRRKLDSWLALRPR